VKTFSKQSSDDRVNGRYVPFVSGHFLCSGLELLSLDSYVLTTGG